MYQIYIFDQETGWNRLFPDIQSEVENNANLLALKQTELQPEYLFAVIFQGSSIPLSIFQAGRQYIWPTGQI